MARDIPFTGIQFTIYESFKQWLISKNAKFGTKEEMITGAAAGCIAGIIFLNCRRNNNTIGCSQDISANTKAT